MTYYNYKKLLFQIVITYKVLLTEQFWSYKLTSKSWFKKKKWKIIKKLESIYKSRKKKIINLHQKADLDKKESKKL